MSLDDPLLHLLPDARRHRRRNRAHLPPCELAVWAHPLEIRENDDNDAALGYDTNRYKVVGVALSGGFAGLG